MCIRDRRYTDSSGLIGNRTRVNYEFRIDVRNNHKNAERVQFEDQLPVSRNEQIQVTLLEPKAQEVKREDDGKLKWDWTLQPGEKRSAKMCIRDRATTGRARSPGSTA